MTGVLKLSYAERLADLQLVCFEVRRLRFDLTLICKILFDYNIKTDKSHFLLLRPTALLVVRHIKYSKVTAESIYENIFAQRVISPRKSLSANEEHFKSLNSFKTF